LRRKANPLGRDSQLPVGSSNRLQKDPDEGNTTMPWTAKSFASRHNKSASQAQAKKAASQASAMVRSGVDKGHRHRILQSAAQIVPAVSLPRAVASNGETISLGELGLTMRTACAQCGGKFGLIRHRWFNNQFCSKQCQEEFLAKLVQDRDRVRQWLDFLKPGALHSSTN
jgi:hypothetical protein